MAKQPKPKMVSRSISVEEKGRKMTNKNGNFSVTVKGKKVKPTSQDSTFYNSIAESANKQKTFKTPVPKLKKKK